jgi:hypothetical protein
MKLENLAVLSCLAFCLAAFGTGCASTNAASPVVTHARLDSRSDTQVLGTPARTLNQYRTIRGNDVPQRAVF